MEIAPLSPAHFEEFLALVDQQVRPAGSSTHAWDDFPLILGQENRDMVFGICANGKLAAGVGCLVRQFQTNCGMIPVAGIGSVVTDPEFRGRGYSRALQVDLIARLRHANVPLAVLWTDRPEYYHGRGFRAAGWEFHVDLTKITSARPLPDGFTCRSFQAADVAAVGEIYDRHPFRTVRQPGDAERLYPMPGTRGLVALGENDQVVATVFCGKGSDFPEYVLEWGGPVGLVVPLVDEARRRGWAKYLLAPPGGELVAAEFSRSGAIVTPRTAGFWLVTQPDQLSRYLQGSGHGIPRDLSDPTALLGTVGTDGVIVPGVLTVAVWGFDSV